MDERTLTEEHATELPAIAAEHYDGPDAFGQGLLRGSVFAGVGWYIGQGIGRIGSKPEFKPSGKPNPRFNSFKTRNFGVLGAFIGGVMGAYGGSRDARGHKRQVDQLQQLVKDQYTQCGELKDELKRQLNGRGRLGGYDPNWEAPKEDAPEPVVEGVEVEEKTLAKHSEELSKA